MSRKIVYIIFAVLAVIGVIGWAAMESSKPGKLDDFAKCLKEKQATFYGAFWCPHCQAQKKLFEKSAKYLLYVECSTADGKSQLKVCTDKKVESYPTWEFADGSRETGEVALSRLAEKTQCVLPN